MIVELSCPKCEADITEWSFDDVQCPQCLAIYETDYETNYDDDIQGPWIVRERDQCDRGAENDKNQPTDR